MDEATRELFEATERSDPVGVARALARGGDPGVFDHEGCVALMVAAFRGALECAEILLPASDPNAQCALDHAFSMTALMLAASESHPEIVALLAPHSDASLVDKMGQSALHLAAYGGDPECARILLGHCDPRARDAQGKTPLAQAVDSRRHACARVLLPASDTDLRDNSGFTPLMAAALNQDEDCVALLLPACSAPDIERARAGAARRGDARVAGMIEAFQISAREKTELGFLLGAQGDRSSGESGRL